MKNILIVEDHAVFRDTLKNILRTSFPFVGIQEASGSEEAMREIGKVAPDLIFMDIRLPGIDGLELTRMIRRSHQGTVIIVLSSHDFPEYREAAFQCGADCFLSKNGITGDELTTCVESAMLKKEPLVCKKPGSRQEKKWLE